MSLKLQVDAAAIASQFKEFSESVENDIKLAVKRLSIEARGFIEKKVQEELKSTRNIYLDNLGWTQINEDVFVVYLDDPAMFIEEGIRAGTDMKPGLLKGKDHVVIPFKYSNAPQNNTQFTQDMVEEVKKELRKNKVGLKKIEYNENGSPKVGKLHEFNIKSPIPGKGNTAALTRLSVYQNKDSKTGKIKRDVLTFRTVSSGPASAGKWISPGFTAKKYLDEALQWSSAQWDNVILPEILRKYD